MKLPTCSYGWGLWALGNYDKAIEAALKSVSFYKELKDYAMIAAKYNQLAIFYRDADDVEAGSYLQCIVKKYI